MREAVLPTPSERKPVSLETVCTGRLGSSGRPLSRLFLSRPRAGIRRGKGAMPHL